MERSGMNISCKDSFLALHPPPIRKEFLGGKWKKLFNKQSASRAQEKWITVKILNLLDAEKAGGFRVPSVAGSTPPGVQDWDAASLQPPCQSTGSDDLVVGSQLGWTLPEEEVTGGFQYAGMQSRRKTSWLSSQAG